MAQEHDQESTRGQKPDLNAIQPGMEVVDTEHELGESDISKPRILQLIHEKYAGGPVGVETIAAALSEERDTIEEVYEPYLMQLGFLDRTPRGRVATERAFDYFKISRRPRFAGQNPLF